MTTCPHCHKRLLSQASARCNWCGESINDAEYQAHAQTERDAYFRHIAAHDAQSLAAMERLQVSGAAYDPLMLVPTPDYRRTPLPPIADEAVPAEPRGTSAHMPGPRGQQPEPSPAQANEPIKTEAEEAGERFRHLEL